MASQKEIYTRLDELHKSNELSILAGNIHSIRELDFLDAMKSSLSIHIFRTKNNFLRNLIKCLLFYLNPRVNSTAIEIAQKEDKFQFIFWPTESNQYDQQVEVANYLIQQGKPCAFAFSNDKMFGIHQQNSIPVIDLRKLQSPMAKLNLRLKGNAYFPTLQARVKDFMEPFAKLVEQSMELLLGYEVDHLVVGNDIAMQGRIGAMVASKLKVKTSCIMHGALSFEYDNDNCRVDNLFVFGERDEHLLKKYLSPKTNVNIQLVGAPYLDKVSFSKSTNGRAKRVLVANSGPGTSVSRENHIESVKGIELLASTHKEVKFVIKLHRKDSLEYYIALKELANVEIIQNDESQDKTIFDYLGQSDLLITGASTTALEASLLDIPTISYDPLEELSETYYMSERVTVYCSTFENLNKVFNAFMAGDNPMERSFEDIRRDFFYKNDGNAAKRIGDCLIEINNEY